MLNCSCLVINTGSSSLKFALLPLATGNANKQSYLSGKLSISNQVAQLDMSVDDSLKVPDGWQIDLQKQLTIDLVRSARKLLSAILRSDWLPKVHIIAHRIVHGGQQYIKPVCLTAAVIEDLWQLAPLAPLHQPPSLKIIEMANTLSFSGQQWGCFDTAFHHTQSDVYKFFAIPKQYGARGLHRYGFHGLSYQCIVTQLKKKKLLSNRVIIAHLGSGASVCAVKKGLSVATSMGFSALDGLMMGTRCGQIDPGLLLYMLSQEHLTPSQLEILLYQQSGLLGVSGISQDVPTLLASNETQAQFAIDQFCYSAASHISSLLPILSGLDLLIFTAGIGEHSAPIREKICNRLSWLSLKLDSEANNTSRELISHSDSAIKVMVLPTEEEKMIAMNVVSEIGAENLP